MFIKSERENFLSQSKGGVLLPGAINQAPPKPEAKYFVNDWFFWESSEQE